MALKIVISLVVVISTLIAVLLFAIARLILVDPALLAGGLQGPIIIACIISGIVLLIPLLIGGGVFLFAHKEKKGKNTNHETPGSNCK